MSSIRSVTWPFSYQKQGLKGSASSRLLYAPSHQAMHKLPNLCLQSLKSKAVSKRIAFFLKLLVWDSWIDLHCWHFYVSTSCVTSFVSMGNITFNAVAFHKDPHSPRFYVRSTLLISKRLSYPHCLTIRLLVLMVILKFQSSYAGLMTFYSSLLIIMLLQPSLKRCMLAFRNMALDVILKSRK